MRNVFTRLTALLVALSTLFVGLGVVAAWYVSNLQHNSSEIVTNYMASVRAAYELEISVREVRRQFFRYLHYGDRKYLEPVPRMKERMHDWLVEAERVSYTPFEQEQMREVRTGYEHFWANYDQFTRELPEGPNDELRQQIDRALTKEILEPAQNYQKFNEVSLNNAYRENEELAGRLIAGLVGLGIFGAAAGIAIGWLVASSFHRSMAATEVQLRTTAQQLNRVAGPYVGPDEIHLGSGELDAAVRSVSASAAAVIERLDRSERDTLRAEQLAYVGQMAAGIAHEVRNPLMAIKILVQKAIECRTGQTFQPRDLRVLETEIVRVEQIITHFLDFARPPRIEKQVLEVRPLLERATASLEARAEQQDVHLRCLTPIEPVFLDVDAGQFQQVLYNLLINALDVLPAGGNVKVELSLEQSHPEAVQTAVIQVEDDGPGLPAHLGEHIFEPFVSSKASGLGLGLSICRRIVEAHGGALRGANGPQGAVFTMRLPVVESEVFAEAVA
jgi:two-component system, NtrC family, sensor histidine kinase HydH